MLPSNAILILDDPFNKPQGKKRRKKDGIYGFLLTWLESLLGILKREKRERFSFIFLLFAMAQEQ